MTRQDLPPKNPSILGLAHWFERQKRVLPWRSEPTLYRVWISEIMLQQTQVVTVLPYFERFMARFASVEALAAALESEVVEAWAGLGYYSRARNLHKGAKAVVAAGGFPRTREGWLEIPGVGPYTAGAIVSIALGQPEPILDGNVERVLSRVLALPRDARFKTRLWRWSALLVRRAHRLGVSPSTFNQALMELGAMVCTPRNARCSECPVSGACAALRLGAVEKFPQKKPPKEWVRVEETRHAWVRLETRELLIERQPEGKWRAGLWDFVESAPPPGKARRLGEIQSRHVVTRHKIERTTEVWAISAQTQWKGSGEVRWASLDDDEVAGSSAYAKVRVNLLEFLKAQSAKG